MPAAPSIERYQPSFYRFPIQNARTGFKPVYLPVILIVPGRRTPEGTPLGNTDVFGVKFFVADAPDPSIVAGPYVFPPPGQAVVNDLIIPQLSRFVLDVSSLQLSDVLIDPKPRQFYNSSGNVIDYEDAVEGDTFQYTLVRGSTSSTIPWYPDADYYDLSFFVIDVEDLPYPQRYHFVWQCSYYRRVVFDQFVSGTEQKFCINTDDISISQYNIIIAHPGEVHEQMFRRTPPFYFDGDNFKLSTDPVVQFYRPYADMLQDIYDEQSFIDGINHIDKIPAQLIPYLAYLIGWDLPNYPGVTDTVRRSILRQAVYLQQLKGSRRAIVELFEIFGYMVDIINLWYTTDGEHLVAPEENIGIPGEQITTETVCQIEPLVSDYSTPGFGEFEVPLLYRATNNITVTAWLVKDGPTLTALQQAAEDTITNPDILAGGCQTTLAGFLIPQELLDRLPVGDPTVVAMSEAIIDYRTGIVTDVVSTSTIPIINNLGCHYDRNRNLVTINFDHYEDFTDSTKLFIFVTYPRTKLIIPTQMNNLRSNRFDVRIMLKNGDVPQSSVLDFLMNFIFKLKAFHSLLRKIIFDVNLDAAYAVQDYCLSDAGNLQVPPAIIPLNQSSNECNEALVQRGFKDEDLTLRRLIYDNLLAENQAWRELDNTHPVDPAIEHFLNIPSSPPEGSTCQFTQYGQDRVISDPSLNLDVVPDTREKVCEDNPTNPNNCFKGRVKADLLTTLNLPLTEDVFCTPCSLGYGTGYYWVFPADVVSNLRNGFGHYVGQNNISFLGKKIYQYNHPIPKSLHYTNRPFLIDQQLESDQLLAYRRPSLDVKKDNHFFPGHRFVFAMNLESDYVHPLWKAKPWDGEDDLNAHLVTLTNGDQQLVFDTVDLIYHGNGIPADVSTYGTHDDRTYQVTHKVYMVTPPGHPAVKLDDVIVETTDESIVFDSSVPFDPLFKSYNRDCNQDYRSGYPAEYGRFNVDDLRGSGHWSEELLDALGFPHRSGSASGEDITALFTYNSGILLEENDAQWRYYEPYRYDCECSQFPCNGSTGSTSTGSTGSVGPLVNLTSCLLDQYLQPDGTYYYRCDQLDIEPRVVLEEQIGICSTLFDGTIPNFLCVTQSGVIPTGSAILPVGSFKWKDEYGTIYSGSWTFKDNVLDITTTVKIPYIWGQPIEGYVENRIVYKKGIVTTIREVFEIAIDGSYVKTGEGISQKVEFFATTSVCGDPPYVDNFCYHYDCAVVDEIDGSVTCGSRWADFGDLGITWSDLVVNSFGVVTGINYTGQPFQWVNVWSDDDVLVHICGSSGS